jgi:hypothetical protein
MRKARAAALDTTGPKPERGHPACQNEVTGRQQVGVQNLADVVRQVVEFCDYFDHGVLHPSYEAADFVDERADRVARPLDE